MPRWEGPPKFQYSPERLAWFREYNRAYRRMLRGGKPPIPYHQRGIMGAAARDRNKAARLADTQKAA